jgi:hypothetical protein
MENMSNKHSLIQKTSVEFQRETEMLSGGLNTIWMVYADQKVDSTIKVNELSKL